MRRSHINHQFTRIRIMCCVSSKRVKNVTAMQQETLEGERQKKERQRKSASKQHEVIASNEVDANQIDGNNKPALGTSILGNGHYSAV